MLLQLAYVECIVQFAVVRQEKFIGNITHFLQNFERPIVLGVQLEALMDAQCSMSVGMELQVDHITFL